MAQHSVLVSCIVPEEHALQALLHDATEAYMGDMVKPLKDIMPEFQAMEEKLQKTIFRRFGVNEEMHPAVKDADMILLTTEQRDIMCNDDDDWGCCRSFGVLPFTITPLPPTEAYNCFMEAYYELTDEIKL